MKKSDPDPETKPIAAQTTTESDTFKEQEVSMRNSTGRGNKKSSSQRLSMEGSNKNTDLTDITREKDNNLAKILEKRKQRSEQNPNEP